MDRNVRYDVHWTRVAALIITRVLMAQSNYDGIRGKMPDRGKLYVIDTLGVPVLCICSLEYSTSQEHF